MLLLHNYLAIFQLDYLFYFFFDLLLEPDVFSLWAVTSQSPGDPISASTCTSKRILFACRLVMLLLLF